MKKITILIGHPNGGSFCAALAGAYHKGAESRSAKVRTIDLSKLNFEPNLKMGYQERMELEPDLLAAQETIKWADHVVIIHPLWWGSMPAVLKGFFDRVLLPGFAYQIHGNGKTWDKLLAGRSARVIITMDSPGWYNRFFYKRASHHTLKAAILEFCGIKPVRTTEIRGVTKSSSTQREAWLSQIETLGKQLG